MSVILTVKMLLQCLQLWGVLKETNIIWTHFSSASVPACWMKGNCPAWGPQESYGLGEVVLVNPSESLWLVIPSTMVFLWAVCSGWEGRLPFMVTLPGRQDTKRIVGGQCFHIVYPLIYWIPLGFVLFPILFNLDVKLLDVVFRNFSGYAILLMLVIFMSVSALYLILRIPFTGNSGLDEDQENEA